MGRQPGNTKLGPKRIHEVRVRGGNKKFRALRLDSGSFSWGSESISKKTRLLAVVYNSSNNELVRTNTLVKGAVIQIDATPFRQWYEAHYAQPIGRKKKKEGQVRIFLLLLFNFFTKCFFIFLNELQLDAKVIHIYRMLQLYMKNISFNSLVTFVNIINYL